MVELNDKIFSRERLAGYDPARMQGSKVLIAGVGALGQNTALNLALSGAGEIRIVDRDRFEEHNRTRSPFFPLPDEREIYGLDKASVVARKLRRLMTAQEPVVRWANKWIQELGDGAFKDLSAVVSCVDSRITRAYLSDKARQHGLPFIEGGFEGENLQLTSIPAANSEDLQTLPCWRCTHPSIHTSFSCRNYARRAEAAGVIPAIQNGAAVLGGLQAEATILTLHDELNENPVARSFSLNIRTWQSRIVKLATDSKCRGVHHRSSITPIKLQTTADDTVKQLLLEIKEYVGSPAGIWLPLRTYSKLFWTAPCTTKGCGRMAAIHSPEWRWIMDSRCSVCGGPFEALNGTTSTYTTPEITLLSIPEVLEATCRQIGFAPLSMIGAAGEDAESAHFENNPPPALFELPGTLDDLYESGETI
jgi:molybdopterin/thiamine biosynthesis adenylyltransferase